MPLSTALSSWVAHGSRTRGEAYFRSGAVRSITVEEGVVEATVRGADLYAVWISREDTRLVASCTCQYFLDRRAICKHIWAVVLAAERQGVALAPPGVAIDDVTLEAQDDPLDEDLPAADHVTTPPREWSRDRLIPFSAGRGAPPEHRPEWRLLLDDVRTSASARPPAHPRLVASQLLYVIDADASAAHDVLVIELMTRERKRNGDWKKPKTARLAPAEARAHPDPVDRHVLERLLGPRPHTEWAGWEGYAPELSRIQLRGAIIGDLVPLICATGRCFVRSVGTARDAKSAPLDPLSWDPRLWTFALSVTPRDEVYEIGASFEHETTRLPMSDVTLALTDGLIVTRTFAARLDAAGAAGWLQPLRRAKRLIIPSSGREALIDTLLSTDARVAEMPDELRVDVEQGHPRPRLRVRPKPYRTDRLEAELSFDYDDTIVAFGASEPIVRAPGARRAVRRDVAAEQHAAATLVRLGAKVGSVGRQSPPLIEFSAHLLSRLVQQLLSEGWHVEASGKTYRRPGATSISVRSGIDWFELHGGIDYDNQHASLPALLAAIDRGERFVRLDDGTLGVVPEEWLEQHGAIARLGTAEGTHLRFERSQASVLDALLAAQPRATWDETFNRVRAELKAFEGVTPADPPASFEGQLRGYQREGLGWLLFLQRFGFGGCLADDMGLGKTVMVLALLASRREAASVAGGSSDNDQPGPALIVVPRSVVFNWRREAERFTPGLRVLEYFGQGRAALRESFDRHDLVLTTYGTLRRDAADLAHVLFDYIVLDESQAIKNASSLSAKAVRLLKARHRLALSGTPIENHLGELWSLFEFLNPGMLSSASAFARLSGAGRLDRSAAEALSHALKPFILRRTKQQVAADLPERTEQTLYCELERPQRALYDELRAHYRRALLDAAEERGGRAKLQVLEALLRLRQAACHPGLVDPRRAAEPSAKIDVLLPRLREAVEEGHKTLVFSQFTSLLAILRTRLEAEGLTYEYLDGRTRDREARVARFQTDPGCPLFLVSLKAGGVGLNLTAAEYVFLLDPWWNPAVEAQAIDRAHRIGQSRHVFAYRLVARDTVEERVLELQQQKRELADAILTENHSLIRELTREDLERLLA